MKIAKKILLALLLTFTASAIIIYPERYIAKCLQGFVMWAECVLPSLFPFMVICAIFIKTGIAEKSALPLKKITGFLRLPQAAAPLFIMSVFSGYPVGARSVAEYCENGNVGKRDAFKLSVLCSTSGPLFIIGSVGVNMFKDKTAGWRIMLAHAISVVVIAIIISLFSKSENKTYANFQNCNGNVLYDAFYGAVISIALAGGFIAFFCVFAQIAYDFYLLYPLEKFLELFFDKTTAEGVVNGIVEVTTGCRKLSASDGRFCVPLAGFLITFGGVSILAQQLCYLLKAKVNAVKFILVKFLQAVLCFCILLI